MSQMQFHDELQQTSRSAAADGRRKWSVETLPADHVGEEWTGSRNAAFTQQHITTVSVAVLITLLYGYLSANAS